MSDVGVVIGTYGDWSLDDPRTLRALESVERQTVDVRCLFVHGETLSEARNAGARKIGTKWLVFLDADDELDPNYVEEMLRGTGDIRRPSTLGIVNGVEDESPVLIPKRDILVSNYIIIGSMCRADLFFDVGGFGAWEVFEDWPLWAFMIKRGAVVEDIPDAIYRVHVNQQGRNSQQQLAKKWYPQIKKAIREFV